MVPAEFANVGLSLRQFYAIAWAHRYATLVILLAITLPTAAVVKFLLPRTYAATSTLMVDSEINDRGNISPALLTSYQQTRIQLMESPKVLMPVIDKLKLSKDREYV